MRAAGVNEVVLCHRFDRAPPRFDRNCALPDEDGKHTLMRVSGIPRDMEESLLRDAAGGRLHRAWEGIEEWFDSTVDRTLDSVGRLLGESDEPLTTSQRLHDRLVLAEWHFWRRVASERVAPGGRPTTRLRQSSTRTTTDTRSSGREFGGTGRLGPAGLDVNWSRLESSQVSTSSGTDLESGLDLDNTSDSQHMIVAYWRKHQLLEIQKVCAPADAVESPFLKADINYSLDLVRGWPLSKRYLRAVADTLRASRNPIAQLVTESGDHSYTSCWTG